MPTTNEAVDFLKTKVDIYIPAKAANAGGVATSALEMAQNSARLFWTSEEVRPQPTVHTSHQAAPFYLIPPIPHFQIQTQYM